MIDKTVPYFNVIMKRVAGDPILAFDLPSGFSWSWFTEGNETEWAKIEASVGEFVSAKEALNMFVRAANGEAVGTISSWWNYTVERRDPSIHWLAVRNEYQGLGVGKALVSQCLNRLLLLETDKDVWLHTQTWSYTAIGLYLKAGFKLVEHDSFSHYVNDYDHAISVLRQVLPSLLR